MSAAVAGPISSVLSRSSSQSRSRRRSPSPDQQLSTSPISDPLASPPSTDLEGVAAAGQQQHDDDILSSIPRDMAHAVDDLGMYSASAQLRFLSHSRAANAELFWQLHTAARKRDSVSSPLSATSSPLLDTGSHHVDPGQALIYVHQVKPTDTLPSILLTYRIDATALRQANRLWAHDTIQSRAVLLLPVDKCGIPMELHLKAKPGVKSDKPGVPAPADLVGWALIETIGEVEICAVPRTKLGFFPRRKNSSQVQNKTRTSVDPTPRSRSSVDSTVSNDSRSTDTTIASPVSMTSSTTSLSSNSRFSLGTAFKSVVRGWGSSTSKFTSSSSSSSSSTTTINEWTEEGYEMVHDDSLKAS
ncbi:hypothetical protein V1509DRAFT_627366 [Lipomyces kononenkoae]